MHSLAPKAALRPWRLCCVVNGLQVISQSQTSTTRLGGSAAKYPTLESRANSTVADAHPVEHRAVDGAGQPPAPPASARGASAILAAAVVPSDLRRARTANPLSLSAFRPSAVSSRTVIDTQTTLGGYISLSTAERRIHV